MMRRAIATHRKGDWPEDKASGSVTLVCADRHRRRIRMTDDAGAPFLLDLPEAFRLEDGDGLELDQGGYLRVRAAAEDVMDVRAATAAHLARIAWHIGNRHTPVQILGENALRLGWDHVLASMLTGLGAEIERKQAPFAPEGGAYADGGHQHAHG